MSRRRISKEESLTFLLQHLVIEREQTIELTPVVLFRLLSLAARAETIINEEEGVIPHEIIESVAADWSAQ